MRAAVSAIGGGRRRRSHPAPVRAVAAGAWVFAALPASATPEPAAVPAFETCRGGLAAWAGEHGIPQPIADGQLLAVEPDPDVLAASRNQGEFVKAIWAYIDASVTEGRIEAGRRKLAEWAPTLDAIEGRYGVDRSVLVAFWGVESSYGAVLGDPGIVRPVIRSLATLACTDPARAAYWRDELTAALNILAQGDAPIERLGGLTGSWAGAMGHTQFMPTVYQAEAVDFDGDGRRDIWTSVPDALASTANYLRHAGWKPGEGWGFEVVLPQGFDAALADETTPRSLSAWRRLGLMPARERTAGDEALESTLILPAGIRGPAFLLLPNFRAILRYNTALAYALTVGQLSDRLRGEPPFVKDWPRGDRTLTAGERTALQSRLAQRGYAVGGIDGKIGPKTRAAVRAYQGSIGLPADGYADASLLERITAAP